MKLDGIPYSHIKKLGDFICPDCKKSDFFIHLSAIPHIRIKDGKYKDQGSILSIDDYEILTTLTCYQCGLDFGYLFETI